MRIYIHRHEDAGARSLSDKECHRALEAVAGQVDTTGVIVHAHIPSASGGWSATFVPRPNVPAGWRRDLYRWKYLLERWTGRPADGTVVTIGVGEANRVIAEMSNMILVCQDQAGGLAFSFAAALYKWYFPNCWPPFTPTSEEAELWAIGRTLEAGFGFEIHGTRHEARTGKIQDVLRFLRHEWGQETGAAGGASSGKVHKGRNSDRRVASGDPDSGDVQ